VARVLSGGAGIIFKGSGFYQTDYKKSAAPAAEKADPGGAKKTEPKAAKTEAKAAAKPAKQGD
jgi:hypothetical protein